MVQYHKSYVHLPTDDHDKLNRRERGLFNLEVMVLGKLLGDAKRLNGKFSRLQIYSRKHTRVLDAPAGLTVPISKRSS